jgi:hypothetical protein
MAYNSFNPYGNSYSMYPTAAPSNYGNGYYQQAPQPAALQAPMDGIIWVQGEVGARAYPVQPGKMAILMDSEDSKFYIKAVDIYGMPAPLRKFRFTEETDPQKLPEHSQAMPVQQPVDTSNYITKEELEKRLNERIDERINELMK